MPNTTTETALSPFLRRARRQTTLRGTILGCLVGSGLLGVCLLVGRLVAYPSVVVGAASCVLAVIVGIWLIRRRLPDDGTLISRMDTNFQSYDRLRTAWELERGGSASPFTDAQRDDALAYLAKHSPEEWIPRLTPRWTWAVPTVFLVAWMPLWLPTRSPEPKMTAEERNAVREAAASFADPAKTPELRHIRRELKRAKTAEGALAVLAIAEHELRRRALGEAGIPQDAPSLADALAASRQELPPDLRERLQAFRDKLAGNPRTAALNSLLNGIETKAVSAEMLDKILHELRNLESNANPDIAAALAQIREHKKAIALAAVDARERGRHARLDEVAGKESGDAVAEGSRLDVPATENVSPTTLALDSLKSASTRETRVFSREQPGSGDDGGKLLPFRQVVLTGQREAETAIRNEALPATYRSRIRAYFDALSSE